MRLAAAFVFVLLGAAVVAAAVYPTPSCHDSDAPIVPASWSVFDGEQLPKILSHDPTPLPEFPAGGDQLERIREGEIFVDERGPLQKIDAVEWAVSDYGWYYATQLHGLTAAGDIFGAGEAVPEDIAEATGAYVKDWARCALDNRSINERAWYEGTVVKRLANLLATLNYMRRYGELESLSLRELLYLIDRNVEFLLEEDVYELGNHGIRQDLLLAATALALPSHPRSDEMLRLAEKRLNTTAVELFSDEGIWLEHAPGYVNYALRLMLEVKKLHDYSNDFSPKLFLQRYDDSLDYLLASLTPDGEIPPVGQSGAHQLSSMVRDQMQEDNRRIRHESKELAAFPDYGHAIVRDRQPQGLYLLFIAAQNLPMGKRHSDELSFLLYRYGRAWITEGGRKTNELTGMRTFLMSPYAHNTYLLGDKFVGSLSRPSLKTKLTKAQKGQDRITLGGFSERFREPAQFERQIEISDFERLVITDRLTSDAGVGKWEGRFHFPGDLKVIVRDHLVLVTDPDLGETMELSFKSDRPLTFATCHGEEEPICGWAMTDGALAPATTLTWRVQGDAQVAISIDWRSSRSH